ncbi:MAG TPA: GGDEF domain-containing protein [Actinomycetales bacterium]
MDQRLLTLVLGELADTLAKGLPTQQVLDHFVERVARVLSATGAGVVLLGEDAELHFVAATDDAILQIEALQVELGEGPCLTAFRTGEPVLMDEPEHDRAHRRFGPRAAAVGLRAVYTFPLVANGTRLGALDVYRDAPGALTSAEIRAGTILANVASAYLASVRARKQAEDALEAGEHRMLHDDLTGLANRALFDDRLRHAMAKARRHGRQLAVLFVDLDRFKSINDRHGHLFGDLVLKVVADRLTASVRQDDTVARFAGDEFVVLCEDVAGPAEAHEVAARIQQSLRTADVVDGRVVDLSASVGLATCDGHSETPADLLRHADAAMFAAKAFGGGRTQMATPQAREQARWDDAVERRLPWALANDELRLVYQPIIDVVTGERAGVEALLRWRNTELGDIEPLTVVAAAARCGLTAALGAWVFERACRDDHAWREAKDYVVPLLCINVAPVELTHSAYVPQLSTFLTAHGTDPLRVCLEVTETSLMSNEGAARRALGDARALGVRVALDDFGTGYSSLAHLRELPVDIIKVDQSFLAGMEAGSVDHRIVAGLTALAHALGMRVTAEGVETGHQLSLVREIGCDGVQGFHLGRPLEAADVPA